MAQVGGRLGVVGVFTGARLGYTLHGIGTLLGDGVHPGDGTALGVGTTRHGDGIALHFIALATGHSTVGIITSMIEIR